MMEDRPKKLLDQLRDAIRQKNYSNRTEQVYTDWVKRLIIFHDKRHPKEMGSPEIKAFLTHLAVEGQVVASTQSQALSAIIFLYRHVLQQELPHAIDAIRAKRPQRLPTVMTKEEALQVIAAMSGTYQLMAQLLYGCGLRLIECVRPRVKDVDFSQGQIIVRDGKGKKDRVTVLPDSLRVSLQEHLHRVKNRSVPIPFGTVLRPIYCRRDMIFGRFKN